MLNVEELRNVPEEYKLGLDLVMEMGGIHLWTYEVDKKRFFNLQRGGVLPAEGMSVTDSSKWIYLEDCQKEEEMFQSVLSGCNQKAEGLFRFLGKDGKSINYYEVRVRSVADDGGKIVRLIGVSKNVTKGIVYNEEAQQLTEQLKKSVRMANLALCEFDTQTLQFKGYNEPVADYIDNKVITFDDYLRCFHPEDCQSEPVKDAMQMLVSGLDRPFSIDIRMKYPGNEDWQYCTIKGVPSKKDKNGKVLKYLCVRVNNTQLIQYQKILEKEKEKALQADKLKSAFLANMSHEIRTPLNAIVGFSELLQTTDDLAMRTEFMNIINTNNELLLQLIGDILDLSKMESGTIELRSDEFDLADIFREMYMTLRQRCNNPAVKFIDRNPYKHCKVKLDKNRLIQVCTNFVTNALKHTEEGYILMGYEYLDGGIKVYVEDTGCGIPKEKQSRLFDRFVKLDDFSQGTGLGLAICKAVTDAFRGKIGMESEEGKGSLFWAWFPCEANITGYEEVTIDGITAFSVPSAGLQNSDIDKSSDKSILVAEDIDSNYLLVKAILRTYTVTRAKTGSEAVALAASRHFDAILMDMKMPEMGGIEATREIREFDHETPIIAVTANAFDTDKEEALKVGCNAFVPKPISKKKLEMILGGI